MKNKSLCMFFVCIVLFMTSCSVGENANIASTTQKDNEKITDNHDIKTEEPITTTITDRLDIETGESMTANIADSEWIQPGEYTVGTDIPPGDYYLEALPTDKHKPANFSIYTREANGDLKCTQAYIIYTFCYLSVNSGQVLHLKNSKMIPEIQAPSVIKTDGYYPPGTYRVGKDIPEGTYYLKNPGESWSAFVLESYNNDSNRQIRSVLSANFGYIYAEAGTYLSVDGASFIFAENAPILQNDDKYYGEGVYLVGKDIEAGKYKITKAKVSDMGSYEIYKDAKYNVNDCVDIEIFLLSKTIIVEDGQYLKITDATFVKKTN